MNFLSGNGLQQTTSYKVVLPFYIYAAIAYLIGSFFFFTHAQIYTPTTHYFHPYTLTIVHTMALGWATMIIFGASHQLLPVLIEGKLDSNFLAYLTFIFAAIGIPFLVYGFYKWHVGLPMQIGAVLINIGVIAYLVNIVSSIYNSSKKDVHAWFIFAAAIWLFSTTFFGLLLVFNFTFPLLPDNSVNYLTLHAHLGIIGWFLLLVIGVGSRLIPMFLISKYSNAKQLWTIFVFVNLSLISFILLRLLEVNKLFYFISIALVLIGIGIFVRYCKQAHKVRIRKAVDEQMKVSLLSVILLLLPILVLLTVLFIIPTGEQNHLVSLYGFSIFFGWLTAIILGMTFKTLPFIVWNKVYRHISHAGKTPVPKDLFKESIYNWMSLSYIGGFVVFIIGIIISIGIILKIGAFLLMISALLYVLNVYIILTHQSKIS